MRRYPHRPGSRTSGPSSEAANRIANHAGTLRRRVLQFIQSNHPNVFTADQIAEHLGESVLSIRPRVAELHRAGKIISTSARVRNSSGMTATTWRAILPSEEGQL